MKPITVVLADDHTIVRKGLRALLDMAEGIDVLGEAENGRDAVKQVEHHDPDVVLMDIGMPILNGLEATRQIKRRFPKTRVIILTMHANEEYVFEVVKSGASGYVIKKAAPQELVAALRAAAVGQTCFGPMISADAVKKLLSKSQAATSESALSSLTGREREVLQLIAEGRSNRLIAKMLFISIKTVEAHRSHLMKKLDLHSAVDLTRYAIRCGIVDPAIW